LSWQQGNTHFAYTDFFFGNVAGLLPAITDRLLRALTSTWFVIFITNGYHAVSKHMWHLFNWTGYSFAIPPPFVVQQPLLGQGLLIIEASQSHSDTPHSVGLLWTSDQPVAETSTW